jgi:hypothetical protein
MPLNGSGKKKEFGYEQKISDPFRMRLQQRSLAHAWISIRYLREVLELSEQV